MLLYDSHRNVFGLKELRAKATKCQEINHYLQSQRVRKQPYRRTVSVADSQTAGLKELRLKSFEQLEENISLVCKVVGTKMQGHKVSRRALPLKWLFNIENKAIRYDSKAEQTQVLLN